MFELSNLRSKNYVTALPSAGAIAAEKRRRGLFFSALGLPRSLSFLSLSLSLSFSFFSRVIFSLAERRALHGGSYLFVASARCSGPVR